MNATLEELTAETKSFYEQKFKRETKRTHPMLDMVIGEDKKVMGNRIQSSWKRVKAFTTWENFIEISTLFLEPELMGDSEVFNLTENIMMLVDSTLEDLGIEVSKLRNGMKVKTQQAERPVRDKVMEMIIQDRILDIPNKEDIKLKLYFTLVA
jgi:hypothetical protein